MNGRMHKGLGTVLVGFLVLSCAPRATAADAASVFKATAPGVALIRDLEGHGSGVVLSSKGVILTCFHVVNTPLPLQVTAMVSVNGRREKMTFDDVELINVHRAYDLAAVRVKLPPGGQLIPVRKSSRVPETGEDCYVIGNPGGAAGEALTNTISTGIISTGERAMDGKNYIQTSAPINPGNSGGALVDKYGNVIGVVSFIISDTEGIGFAIPFWELDKEDFIKRKDLKGDIKKAIEYEELGSQWYARSRRLGGEARDVALAIAYTAYRLSLAEAPNDPSPYNNLGNIYCDKEEYKTGKYFFEKALELDGGKSPIYYKMLGICEDELGNSDRANALWKKGVLCEIDDEVRSECAENLAIAAIQNADYSAAAYLVKWANALAGPRRARARVRKKIYQESINELPDAQFRYLSRKRSGFSFQDLAAFNAGRMQLAEDEAPNASASEPEAASIPAEPASSLKEMYAKVRAEAPDPGPEGLTKKIPESVTDCRPAFGGVYLVMKFPELKKLGVFNIAQLSFEEYISIPSAETLYACGGNLLVTFDPHQKLFEIYNLATFKRLASRMSRLQGFLTDMNMALLKSDVAVVSWADGTGALDDRQYGLMEIPSMRVTPFRSGTKRHQGLYRNNTYRNNIHLRLDPRLKRFVCWCTSHSPTGFIYGTLDGLRVKSHYEHGSYGSLSLLPDPGRVVGARGVLLDPKGNVRHKFKGGGVLLFPVHGANMVIKVEDDKATVIDANNLTELQSFTLPFKLQSIGWAKNDFTTDRQVFASVHLDRAAFLDNKGREVAVFKLTGKNNPGVLADQLAGVKPGSLWKRQLNLPPGTKVTVEDAPPGVKFDSDTMTLAWRIPRDLEPGTRLILISVTPPDEEEAYRRVSVTIR